tara:strand:- start:72 stop:527 length:456 start_codon:yes stop_codon:yes gene_type:complete
MMAYATNDSQGSQRRESNPWIEDTLEKEIKRLTEEKEHLEEVSFQILKMAKETKKRIKRGISSQRRLNEITKCLPEIRNRHYNISMRIEKLEWDYCNIVEVIDKECKYKDCNCKKINLIRFPKDYVHYAKEECSRCGRWQKFIPPINSGLG